MQSSKATKIRVNNAIKTDTVLLIDELGVSRGPTPIREALAYAASKSLDLVEVDPNGRPPVCRIQDYNKSRFDEKKKQKKTKKTQKSGEYKRMRFRFNIAEGDLNIKIKMIRQFLGEGNKVAISLRFIGREITHSEHGVELLQKIVVNTKDIAKVEAEPKLEGNQLHMTLGPSGKR